MYFAYQLRNTYKGARFYFFIPKQKFYRNSISMLKTFKTDWIFLLHFPYISNFWKIFFMTSVEWSVPIFTYLLSISCYADLFQYWENTQNFTNFLNPNCKIIYTSKVMTFIYFDSNYNRSRCYIARTLLLIFFDDCLHFHVVFFW